MGYNSRSVSSKWKKTKWLMNDAGLAKYSPETLLFNERNLTYMVRTHRVVYFKPNKGSGGANIIRIEHTKKGSFVTQYKSKQSTFESVRDLFRFLLHFSKGKRFLLQQGIDMLRVRNSTFDIRVMVQKSNQGNWITTAVFAKVGNPNVIVNNCGQGGKIVYFKQVMQDIRISEAEIVSMKSTLNDLGVQVAECFEKNFTGFREIGLDVAIDHNMRIWILEVNTRPQIGPLTKLKNKTMYNRIVSYGKQYGRF